MKRLKAFATVSFHIRLALTIAMTLLLAGQGVAIADSTPFSRIVVFGDSLSDTGNLYGWTGGQSNPSPPYFEGRFCNGPIWIEYLVGDMGMALLPEDNYAWGGAITGRSTSANVGQLDEVDWFFAAHPEGADPAALYVLWAGHNDFFIAFFTAWFTGGSPEAALDAVIDPGIRNTLEAVQTLWSAGARQIMVVSVADLGTTPLIRGFGPSASGLVSTKCAVYHQALEAALRELAAAGIPTAFVGGFAWLDAIVASPSAFGFTNVTDAFLLPDYSFASDDPAPYLFWVRSKSVGRAKQSRR